MRTIDSAARRPRGALQCAAWAAANSLEIGAALMLLAICITVFAGVFFRYFLHIGLGWTEETARFLQIWMTFVGATIAVKRWSHFQLVLIDPLLHARARQLCRIFAPAMVACLAAVLVRHGWSLVQVTWEQTSPMLGWRIGAVYAVVPASGALMFLFALRHLFAAWRAGPVAAAPMPIHE